jgi:flagellin
VIIAHNLMALSCINQLNRNNNAACKLMQQLSSGMRINCAADDPAGLAISEKMRAQIRGLNQAERNAQDGISLIQVAEGGISSIQDALQRMYELCIQGATGTLSDEDRQKIQIEIDQLKEHIGNTSNNSEFNGIKLLDGSRSKDVTGIILQIGAGAGQSTIVNIDNMDLDALGLGKDFKGVLSREDADSSISILKAAIDYTSSARSSLGAKQNALEYTINNLSNYAENLTAAESRIRDVDMAKAMAEFVKYNILTQAAQAMLAQANHLQYGVLQLLQSTMESA